MFSIQPQGATWDYAELNLLFYQTLRELGLDVDVAAPHDDLSGYRLVVAPSSPFAEVGGHTRVYGPRSCSQTVEMAVRLDNPFGVRRVESLTPGLCDDLHWNSCTYPVERWRERAEFGEIRASFGDGEGALWEHGGSYYLGFWPDRQFLKDWLKALCEQLHIPITPLGAGLRLRRRGDLTFCFNYSAHIQEAPSPAGAHFILGQRSIAPHSLALWSTPNR
jgi:beta-galactosidase